MEIIPFYFWIYSKICIFGITINDSDLGGWMILIIVENLIFGL